jgi:sugar phosphate isomerase/epimerase
MLDLFHGNIEEASQAGTIAEFSGEIAHIHLADSNRLQPGKGHLDFRPVFRALREIGYGGTCAMECTVVGLDAMQALKETVRFLRGCE